MQHFLFLSPAHRRQRGVYALEWAIIFPVFFVLLYAIICYGLTFLVRESMQFAIEEGARAALRYPVGQTVATWTDRKTQALQAVQDQLQWLPENLRPTSNSIEFRACALTHNSCPVDTELDPNLQCSAQVPCLVLLSYTITDYPTHAIAPALPGFGLLLPSTLQASASILIDRELL